MTDNRHHNEEILADFELRPLKPYYNWSFDRLWDSHIEKVARRKALWTQFKDSAPEDPCIVPWHHALQFRLFLGHDLSRQLYIAGCYEPNSFYALDHLLYEGNTVIDIGAHEGLFSLFCAQKVGAEGKVYAFEPSPRERDRLQRNVELNELKQIEISDRAVTQKSGQGTLKIAESTHSGQNTLGDFVHEGVSEDSTATVETISLDNFVEAQSLSKVDFIKIDAEGSEALILEGAQKTLRDYRPCLLFEFLPASLKKQGREPSTLLESLKALNYNFYHFAKDGLLELASEPSGEEIIALPEERSLPEALLSQGSYRLGESLYKEREKLEELLPRIKSLRQGIGEEGNLQGYQWIQWVAMIRGFRPDLVIQLGRGSGPMTAALCLAFSTLDDGQKRELLSLGSHDSFQRQGLEFLRTELGREALTKLTLVTMDHIENYDFQSRLARSRRPLVLWQSYSPELANALFGSILPQISDVDHRVILHGLTDLHYHQGIERSYQDQAFWRESNPKNCAALLLGGLFSPDGKALSLLDFCERNKLTPRSGDAELHEYFDAHPEQEKDLTELLGGDFLQREAHWYSLIINEGVESLYYPAFHPCKERAKPVAWSLNPDHAPAKKQGQLPCPADALLAQSEMIAQSWSQYSALIESLDFESIIQKSQWAQLRAFIHEFEPDCIVELGRGYGASTVMLNEACRALSNCQLLSADETSHWDEITEPRLRELVDADWFSSLNALQGIPEISRLEAALEGKERVVIYLENSALSLVNWLYAELFPRIQDRKHVVIVKNITDSRFNTVDTSYKGRGIWKIGRGAGELHLGQLCSSSEQTIAVVDFCSRNHLPLHSVDQALREKWGEDGAEAQSLRREIGDEAFSLSGHWFYFSMLEAPGDLTFPVLTGAEQPTEDGDKKPFQAPEQHSTNNYEETINSVIPSLAHAIKSNVSALVEHRDELLKLQDAVGHSTDLSFNQWNQLFAYTLEFQPDLIIELGRGRGNSTCLFTQAARALGPESSCQVLSLCNSEDWAKETRPKIEALFGAEWFESLTAESCDILRYDPSPFLSRAKRVMIFWDAHGFEIAEWMLGAVLPQLVDKEHAILMHDMTDTRFNSGQEPYRGRPLWMGNNWSGPRLRMGHIDSAVEQSIAIIDFSSRNHLPLYSADFSLQNEIGPKEAPTYQEKLGKDAFSLYAHWFYFSLNDAQAPLQFPSYQWPAPIVEEPSHTEAESQSESGEEEEEKKQSFIMKLKVAGGILLGRVPIDPWI